ncbi:hypothetical protein B7494_g499 [Chlorociboria aeruginascens]|nr:hypothetical protein B7494_g499 [Chlorociboria aeruginascens]
MPFHIHSSPSSQSQQNAQHAPIGAASAIVQAAQNLGSIGAPAGNLSTALSGRIAGTDRFYTEGTEGAMSNSNPGGQPVPPSSYSQHPQHPASLATAPSTIQPFETPQRSRHTDELHMSGATNIATLRGALSPRDYTPSGPRISLEQATPDTSQYPGAGQLPGSLQPGRPAAMSSNTAPAVPTISQSMSQEQYTTPSRSSTVNLSHNYTRSSPAGGFEGQGYAPFSATTPTSKDQSHFASPTNSKYTTQAAQRAISNTPLGLADIRPRADSSLSDGLPGANPYSYDGANAIPTNSNYLAPWAIYAFDWCKWPAQNHDAGKVAVGSYLEDGHNFIQILDSQITPTPQESYIPGAPKYGLDFVKIAEATHSYPVTRLLWEPPSSQKQTTDLLATSGDHLRLWSLPSETPAASPSNSINRSSTHGRDQPPSKLTPLALLSNSKTPEHTAPLTSLDWNTVSPSLIITSSIDTTCTIWDIPTLTAKTQLIAHDKEVFDVRFCANSVDVFVSCGADGSVRMFDLRSLEHSTIIYEPTVKDDKDASPSGRISPTLAQQTMSYAPPLLRLAASPHDTHLLATFSQDSNIIRILDVRQPGQALLELRGHASSINCIEWSPSRRGTLASGADDSLVLVWDLLAQSTSLPPPGPAANGGSTPDNTRGPAASWQCDYEVGNISWAPHSALSNEGGDWLGPSLQILTSHLSTPQIFPPQRNSTMATSDPRLVDSDDEEDQLNPQPVAEDEDEEEEQAIPDHDEEEDDEEEDEDEEDVGPRRKRRRERRNQFLDVEAEVDEDEDENEDDEDELNEIKDNFIADTHPDDLLDLPAGGENDDRRHRELDRRREMEASLDAEKQAEILRQRYANKNRSGRALGDSAVVPKRLLLPSVDDPSIWAVRCKEGKEREAVFSIMKRIEERLGTKDELAITSAFERGGTQSTMKGFIYVEAQRQADIMVAMDGLMNVYPRTKMMLVEIKEMPDLLRVTKSPSLEPGAYVRLKRPPKYAGDLAQVIDVTDTGLELRVRYVPRLDYGLHDDLNAPADASGVKRKRPAGGPRPPQRLFSEVEAKKRHAKYLQGRPDTKTWSYLGDEYINGYCEKDVKIQTLVTQEVNPTLEEVTRFASGAEDGTENLDLNALAASLKASTANASYLPGDVIEVYEGEQKGVVGKAISVQGDIVSMAVSEGALKGQTIEVPVKGLRKRFKEGDHVKVIGGSRFRDDVGMVVKIVDDRVTLLNDQGNNEITVFSKDLREASDSGGGGSLGQFELWDLVQLDGATVACIVKVDRESLVVLDQNSQTRSVMPSQISNKIDKRNFAVATDKNGSEIRVDDVVKEAGGENRTGKIRHIHRAFLFLHSSTQSENAGIFVTRTSNVATVSAKGGRVAMGPDLTSMNPALKRNPGVANDMPPPKSFGRDKSIGQTVTIRRGPYKGLLGIVKETTETNARVELHTKNKTVNVPKEALGFKDKISGQTIDPNRGGGRGGFPPRYRGGIGSDTPSGWEAGGRTPAVSGPFERTPSWGTSRTPAGGANGGRTPAWKASADITGGRTPGWADGSRTVHPNDGSRTSYGGGNRTPAWSSGAKTPAHGLSDPFASGSKTPGYGGGDAWGSKTPAYQHPSNANDNWGANQPSSNGWGSSTYDAPTPGAPMSAPTPAAMNAPTPSAYAAPTPTPYAPTPASAPTPAVGWGGDAPTPGGPQNYYGGAPTPAPNWGVDAPTPGGQQGYYAAPTPGAYMPETPATNWQDDGPRCRLYGACAKPLIMAHNYVLQVTAGSGYDIKTHQVVPVNDAKPITIESEHMKVDLNVRIQSYRGLPKSSATTSAYFNNPPHDKNKDQYSIAFNFTPKTSINGDALVFGNSFEHPIRDRLPPGFGTAFKIVKWVIDPGLDGDPYSDKPYLYGPALSSLNVIHVGSKGGDGIEPDAEAGLILHEGGDGEGMGVRKEKSVPEAEAGRKKHFLNEERRKEWMWEEGRVYGCDFFNPYLDFNDFALRLPGFTLPIMNYWDGQGLRRERKRSHTLRYVLLNRETDTLLFAVVFSLYLKEDVNEDGTLKDGVEGGKPLCHLPSELSEKHEVAKSGNVKSNEPLPETNEDDVD